MEMQKAIMEDTRVRVCGGLAVSAFLSLILGLSATSDPQRMGLGISAAMILLLSQILVTLCGGLICCSNYGRPPLSHGLNMTAILCFVLYWVYFTICFSLLMIGAMGEGPAKNMIVVGAALSPLVSGFGAAYYLLVTNVTSQIAPSNGNSGRARPFPTGSVVADVMPGAYSPTLGPHVTKTFDV